MISLSKISSMVLVAGLSFAAHAEELQTPAGELPDTECTKQFLSQPESIAGDAVCARTVDDAITTKVRVGQAAVRHVALDFENFVSRSERRCDCEFAYGRYDLTPRTGWSDRLGWWRAICRKVVSVDGASCGSKWYEADEGFQPTTCDVTQNPKHDKCIPGSFVSELRDPDTEEKKIVPVTICARKDGSLNPDGTPKKDGLVIVVDAQTIPKYKKYINSCINISVVKNPETKQISFTAIAPAHPLPEVRRQELLRGELRRKAD